MLDAIVQLLRNAGCCIKDLNLFPQSVIHDPVYTSYIFANEKYPYFPPPMNKTSPLELFISMTQLYACISCTKAGIRLIATSLGKMQRLRRVAESRADTLSLRVMIPPSGSKKKKAFDELDMLANVLVTHSILKEAKFAIRSIIVGTCVAPIGVCFFWLFINSLHISETDWFGGVAALIHALEVMEFALVFLLYYMIQDGFERFQIAKQCQALLDKIDATAATKSSSSSSLGAADITLSNYEAMTGWVPFWDGGVSLWATAPAKEDEDLQMEHETQTIKQTLASFLVLGDDAADETKKEDEKEAKIRKETLEGIATKLTADIPVYRMEGYREWIYFVLNFIAFYGYLMAPLCFYYQEEAFQPYPVHSMKFFYKNDDADWYGNFYGDLMWTIEPMIILASPTLTSWIKSSNTRTKAVLSTKTKGTNDNKSKSD